MRKIQFLPGVQKVLGENLNKRKFYRLFETVKIHESDAESEIIQKLVTAFNEAKSVGRPRSPNRKTIDLRKSNLGGVAAFLGCSESSLRQLDPQGRTENMATVQRNLTFLILSFLLTNLAWDSGDYDPVARAKECAQALFFCMGEFYAGYTRDYLISKLN